jgi:predicted nucleic acid-binding protein
MYPKNGKTPFMSEDHYILFDAGLFIGALLRGDSRHQEARALVEAGRRGEICVCTTVGILSEVYAALTWIGAKPPHIPDEAAEAIRALVGPPSKIQVLNTGLAVALEMLNLVETHRLTARRTHDARHAATALVAGIHYVYTYDSKDWRAFEEDGLSIAGPPSILEGSTTR